MAAGVVGEEVGSICSVVRSAERMVDSPPGRGVRGWPEGATRPAAAGAMR